MRSVSQFVRGVPYGQDKVRGDTKAPAAWTERVVTQTRELPRISGPCVLKVTFYLPGDKFPPDHPFGNDLDNLVKRFCDALKTTVLADAPGQDGAIVMLEAAKARVDRPEDAGARFEIIEVVNP
jgi:Holliday junction resolvase RusA-like endonuclease